MNNGFSKSSAAVSRSSAKRSQWSGVTGSGHYEDDEIRDLRFLDDPAARKNLKVKLAEIEMVLNRIDGAKAKKVDRLLKVGRTALEIRDLVENSNSELSLAVVFRCYFKKRKNRIDEGIAALRAVSAGAPKELPITSLIRLGQRLENPNVSDRIRSVISSNGIELDGEFKPLSKVPATVLVRALSEMEGIETTHTARARIGITKVVRSLQSTKSSLAEVLRREDEAAVAGQSDLSEIIQLASEIVELCRGYRTDAGGA